MSRVSDLLDESHRIAARAGYVHVKACVQRKAPRAALLDVAQQYRRAADLVEEAVALLSKPEPQGDKHSE